MDLIKRIYEDRSENTTEIRKTTVLYGNVENVESIMRFLANVYCFDTDLYFPEFDNNMELLFGKLGIELIGNVSLMGMKIGSSRYTDSQGGTITFNYHLLNSENRDDNMITYYSSNELFLGEKFSIYPGVKLSSGNESLYYSVGSVPVLRKYSIELNEDITLTREYSSEEVLFTIEGKTTHLVIRVKKPASKVVENNYELDNEMLVLDYLKTLTGTYDVMDIYNKLCEISLGNDVSMYQEITVCESIKNKYGCCYCDSNLISVRNGDIESVVRTIGDKTITLSSNGCWSYVLSDEFVSFKISSGKTMKYHIETKTEKQMDDYTDGLLRYDVNSAKKEVEETRELVRRKCKLENKRG